MCFAACDTGPAAHRPGRFGANLFMQPGEFNPHIGAQGGIRIRERRVKEEDFGAFDGVKRDVLIGRQRGEDFGTV